MDFTIPLHRSPVVMQEAAVQVVSTALSVLEQFRGSSKGFGADVDTCSGFYIVEFRPLKPGFVKPLTVRIKASTGKVVWNSDVEDQR